MDSAFWLGVIATTVLAVPAGAISIALHTRAVRYLDSRKITSREKRIQEARNFYKTIQDLRAGRRDKYIYMLRTLIDILVPFIVGVGAFVGTVVTIALAVKPIIVPHGDMFAVVIAIIKQFILPLALLFLTFVGIFTSVLAIRRFRSITNALEGFDDYERHFLDKWAGHNEQQNLLQGPQ